MGMIDDVLKALDRIPIWKRLGEVPDEVDDLKQRVAEREEKLLGKRPPDVCRKCGARALRLRETLGPGTRGYMREQWVCSECNGVDARQVRPS